MKKTLSLLSDFFCPRVSDTGSKFSTSVLMSTISKRKQKRYDIEAYYRNESKTFLFGPLKIGTEAERFGLVQIFWYQKQFVSVLAHRFWDEANQFDLVQKLLEAKWNVPM
jgi:hypothetical protein